MGKVNESTIPSELFEVGKHVRMALILLGQYAKSTDADRKDLVIKVDDSLNDAIYNLGDLASYEFQNAVYSIDNTQG